MTTIDQLIHAPTVGLCARLPRTKARVYTVAGQFVSSTKMSGLEEAAVLRYERDEALKRAGIVHPTRGQELAAEQEARAIVFAFEVPDPEGHPAGPLQPPARVPDLAVHDLAMQILKDSGVTGYVDQAAYDEACRQARQRLGRGV